MRNLYLNDPLDKYLNEQAKKIKGPHPAFRDCNEEIEYEEEDEKDECLEKEMMDVTEKIMQDEDFKVLMRKYGIECVCYHLQIVGHLLHRDD